MGYLYNVGNNRYISFDVTRDMRSVEAETIRELVDLSGKKFPANPNYFKNAWHAWTDEEAETLLMNKAEGATQTIVVYFKDYKTPSNGGSVPCVKANFIMQDANGNYLEMAPSSILPGRYGTYLFNPSQLEVLRENGFEVPECKVY